MNTILILLIIIVIIYLLIKERMIEVFKTFIIAILVAVFWEVLLEPFTIPSGSMKPNLLVGDFLFVSKFSYGCKYSVPYGRYLPFKGRVFYSEPKKRDIAVFKFLETIKQIT